MDLNYAFKPTELTKIRQEISSESNYCKDMMMNYNLGYAEGFIAVMKFMSEKDRLFTIEEIVKLHNIDADNKIWEYIIRLYNEKIK